jgi:cephalosporin-C deacetylase
MMGENRGVIQKPDDFGRYWDDVLRIVDQTDPEIRTEKWEIEDPNYEAEFIIDGSGTNTARDQTDVNPFDFRWGAHTLLVGSNVTKVLFESYDGQEVGGLLQVPRLSHKKKLPGIVHFTGYGGELMVDPDFVSSGYAVLNFSHRGMVLGSKGFDRYSPVPLLVRDVDDRNRYVYRSIVVDCLLAIKILRAFKEIDRRRIGVMGTSQGGALSLMTTVLNRDIRAACLDIPWLTDFSYQLTHDVEGPYNEIKEYLRRFPKKRDDALCTLAYYDTLFFADRIDRPVLISLGLNDTTCPPDSVRNLFHRIKSIKALLEIPEMSHERSTIWRYLSQKWFDFYL